MRHTRPEPLPPEALDEPFGPRRRNISTVVRSAVTRCWSMTPALMSLWCGPIPGGIHQRDAHHWVSRL
jgi:hypothetical protein